MGTATRTAEVIATKVLGWRKPNEGEGDFWMADDVSTPFTVDTEQQSPGDPMVFRPTEWDNQALHVAELMARAGFVFTVGLSPCLAGGLADVRVRVRRTEDAATEVSIDICGKEVSDINVRRNKDAPVATGVALAVCMAIVTVLDLESHIPGVSKLDDGLLRDQNVNLN